MFAGHGVPDEQAGDEQRHAVRQRRPDRFSHVVLVVVLVEWRATFVELDAAVVVRFRRWDFRGGGRDDCRWLADAKSTRRTHLQ